MSLVVPDNTMQSYTPNKTSEEVIDLSQYWRTIKRSKWSIISVTLICFLLGIMVSLKSTPIYSASVKLQADPTPPNASAQDQYMMNSLIYLFYETQYEIIQSRAVAEDVVDKLGLVERYKQEQKERAKESSGSSSMMDSVKELIAALKGETKQSTEPEKELTDQEIRLMLATTIQGAVTVKGGKQSQIININYESDDPELATNIINAVAESYIAFDLQARLKQIRNTSAWLSDQSGELKAKVQEAEDRLKHYQAEQGMIDTVQQQRMAAAQLSSLNTELVRAQSKASQTAELYQKVKSLSQQRSDYASLGPVLQNQTVKDLVKEEARLERKVEELSDRYGEKHPKMIAARSDLSGAEQTLKDEVSKIVQNIETEYRLAQTQVTNIKKLIADSKQEMQSLRGSNLELLRLEREVENSRRLYEGFVSRSVESDVSGDYKGSNVRIIDLATQPKAPIKPKVQLILAVSLVGGLFLGVVLAFVRESLENNFRTTDSIEQKLGIPSLGITPAVKKTKEISTPELQYLTDTRTPFAEAINTIRTGLIFSNIDNPPQTILVTSTSGSEGKSTLSINLAASFSQLDKTLLIELDLRKPTLAKNLKLSQKNGLCDLLAGSANPSDVIHKLEGHEQLSVLPCGMIPPNPMELISSQKFERMLAKLKEHYKHIVIDSPPTLPVSDSSVLGKLSDAVVLAVKAEDTKIRSAKETLNRLGKVNVKVSGAVLTQASPQKMSYYGDHYYANAYYGYKET